MTRILISGRGRQENGSRRGCDDRSSSWSGMIAGFEDGRKSKETDSLLRPAEGTQPCCHLNFSLERPISDF